MATDSDPLSRGSTGIFGGKSFGSIEQTATSSLVDACLYLSGMPCVLPGKKAISFFKRGRIPIINENDTVTTDEIRFGDNDTLAALVTNLVEADVLVLLTDQAGLYTADPRQDPTATLIRSARANDASLEAIAGGAGSELARGGMLTKVLAAKRAARSGAATIIASGREENVLTRLVAGEPIGTELAADMLALAARKQWLADHVRLAGT